MYYKTITMTSLENSPYTVLCLCTS